MSANRTELTRSTSPGSPAAPNGVTVGAAVSPAAPQVLDAAVVGTNAGGRHPKKHLRMVPAPESIRAWIRDNPPSCTAIPYYCSNFQTCITCSRVQAASIVDIHTAVLVPIHKFGMQEWNSAEIIVRIAL